MDTSKQFSVNIYNNDMGVTEIIQLRCCIPSWVLIVICL